MPRSDSNWSEDAEAMEIALRLVGKYPDLFAGLDLTRVRFVRKLAGTAGSRAGEIKPCVFPFSIDSPYAYYLVIDNALWKKLSDAQRSLTVMHLLYATAPQGTKESSPSWAKLRKHDVEDYNAVLRAAGGRYDWQTLGAEGVLDPLSETEEQK